MRHLDLLGEDQCYQWMLVKIQEPFWVHLLSGAVSFRYS